MVGLQIVAKLTIPQRNRDGLSKLLALPSEAFDQFVASLEAQPANVELPSRLLDVISVAGVPKTDLDRIVTAVIALCLVRWSGEISLDSFVQEITGAIESFDPIGGSEESKRRLHRILSVEPLMIASKALTIVSDYQRTLHTTKILTDVRYIFRSNPEQEPYGAVIVHLLKLTYHEDTGHREFFVAMDDNDLAHLKAVLERAEEKAITLRRKLDAQATAYLGVTRRNKGNSE
jgi:hypothetical protein